MKKRPFQSFIFILGHYRERRDVLRPVCQLLFLRLHEEAAGQVSQETQLNTNKCRLQKFRNL